MSLLSGVAALAVGNQVFDLAITLFSFVSIGTSVVITQYLGAGDKEKPASSSHRHRLQPAGGTGGRGRRHGGAGTMLALMNLPAHLMSDGSLYLQIIGLCLLPEAAASVWPPPLRAPATPARPCT